MHGSSTIDFLQHNREVYAHGAGTIDISQHKREVYAHGASTIDVSQHNREVYEHVFWYYQPTVRLYKLTVRDVGSNSWTVILNKTFTPLGIE